MNLLWTLIALVLAAQASNNLPSRKKTRKMQVHQVAQGKKVAFNVKVDLPDGQKLNEGAPSNIAVYEQTGDTWKLAQKIDLRKLRTVPGQDVDVLKSIHLEGTNSTIAIDSTIYHCSIEKGPCYIDSFQQQVQRKQKLGKELSATLFPVIPK